MSFCSSLSDFKSSSATEHDSSVNWLLSESIICLGRTSSEVVWFFDAASSLRDVYTESVWRSAIFLILFELSVNLSTPLEPLSSVHCSMDLLPLYCFNSSSSCLSRLSCDEEEDDWSTSSSSWLRSSSSSSCDMHDNFEGVVTIYLESI